MVKKYYFDVFISLLVSIITFELLDKYIAGDQEHYKNFFGLAHNVDLITTLNLAPDYIGTREPLYPILIWFASRVTEKKIFISLSNGVLAYLTIKLMLQYGYKRLICYPFVTLNFYMIVLYTGAERLKFSIILFLIGLLFYQRGKINRFWMWTTASIFTHVQTIILLSGEVIGSAIVMLKRKVDKKRLLLIANFCVILFIFLTAMWPHMHNKIIAHSRGGIDLIGLSKIIFIYIAALLSSGSPIKTTCFYVSLLFASILVGEERLVIFAYFGYILIYGNGSKKLSFPFFWMLFMYFTWKTFYFIENIYMNGDGFAAVSR